MSEIISLFSEKCEKSVAALKSDLSKVRTGRASAGILEGVMVDYYGTQTPLKQLAMINAPEARLLTVQIYDKGAIEAVEKAILQSNLGLNPARDGDLVRVSIPSLTEDRRKDLVKQLKKTGEDFKTTLRSHRRDANDEIKKQEKEKMISEDDRRKIQDEVQTITDKYVAEVDVLVAAKEKDMMEV